MCSVACGKGVQQRFRRCLLDNPMVNLNMNFNNHNDDDLDEEDDIDVDVDADVVVEMELEEDLTDEDGEDSDSIMVDNVDVGNESEPHNTLDNKYSVIQTFTTSGTSLEPNVSQENRSENNLITGNMLQFVTTTPRTMTRIETTIQSEEEPEVMRIFEGHFNDTFSDKISAFEDTLNNGKSFKQQLTSSSLSASPSSAALPVKDKLQIKKTKKQIQQQQQQHEQKQKLKVKHRKHKSAKLYSTMFCEGYNIEQRNCNSFECSGKLLKHNIYILSTLPYSTFSEGEIVFVFMKLYPAEDDI